jgi:hypothetical protein
MSQNPVSAIRPFRQLLGAALVVLAAAQVQGASAQSAARPAAQAIPAPLIEARKAWAAAVLKRDAPAAAALAFFPLQNEAYQDVKSFGRAAYLRNIEGWSTLKTCLATEPMARVKGRSRLGTHSFNCDGHGFFFAEKSGVWRHTGYENSNE